MCSVHQEAAYGLCALCSQILGAGRHRCDPKEQQRAAPRREPAGVRLRSRRGPTLSTRGPFQRTRRRPILRLGPDIRRVARF